MPHIKSLKLKNFRSWKDGLINFHPGVNIITGPNDSGKSNILRAINWVARNQPTGWTDNGKETDFEGIRSYWADETKVTLELEKKVTRFRSKSKNQYFLEGSKEPFEGFGIKVPGVISDFINFSDININFQLDGPFLLSKSPPEVARYYNSLVNLDIIDRSISNINKVIRNQKSDLKVQEKIQDEKEKELKQYEWLDEAEQKLIQLEKKQEQINLLNLKFSKLSQYIHNIKNLNEELSNIEIITSLEAKLNKCLGLSNKIFELKTNKEKFEKYKSNIRTLKNKQENFNRIIQHENKVLKLIELDEEIENKTNKYNKLLNYIDNIETNKKKLKKIKNIIQFENKLIKLLEIDKIIENKTNLYNKLLGHINSIKDLNIKLEKANQNIKKLGKEFKYKFPNVCPLCGK